MLLARGGLRGDWGGSKPIAPKGSAPVEEQGGAGGRLPVWSHEELRTSERARLIGDATLAVHT